MKLFNRTFFRITILALFLVFSYWLIVQEKPQSAKQNETDLSQNFHLEYSTEKFNLNRETLETNIYETEKLELQNNTLSLERIPLAFPSAKQISSITLSSQDTDELSKFFIESGLLEVKQSDLDACINLDCPSNIISQIDQTRHVKVSFKNEKNEFKYNMLRSINLNEQAKNKIHDALSKISELRKMFDENAFTTPLVSLNITVRDYRQREPINFLLRNNSTQSIFLPLKYGDNSPTFLILKRENNEFIRIKTSPPPAPNEGLPGPPKIIELKPNEEIIGQWDSKAYDGSLSYPKHPTYPSGTFIIRINFEFQNMEEGEYARSSVFMTESNEFQIK